MPNLVEEPSEPDARELRNKQDRSRDLFGVQLEVSINCVNKNVDLVSFLTLRGNDSFVLLLSGN